MRRRPSEPARMNHLYGGHSLLGRQGHFCLLASDCGTNSLFLIVYSDPPRSIYQRRAAETLALSLKELTCGRQACVHLVKADAFITARTQGQHAGETLIHSLDIAHYGGVLLAARVDSLD